MQNRYSHLYGSGGGLAGFGAGLTALADGIAQRAERKKQEYDNGKIADAFVKTNPEVLKSLGYSDENEFKALSAQDRFNSVAGYMKALGVKEAMAEQEQKAKLNAELLKRYQRENQEADREAESTDLFNRQVAGATVSPRIRAVTADLVSPEFKIVDLNRFSGMSAQEQPMPDMRELQMFAARAGINPRQQYEISQAFENFSQGNADNGGAFTEDPVTGSRFFAFGRSVLPSGVNPKVKGENPTQPQEIKLNGASTGWALFPDGRYRQLPKGEDKINAAQFDSDGDGVLSQAEWVQAVQAEKFGGVYPGMRVGPGATKQPTPTEQAGLWDRFLKFKKK